MTFRAAEKGTHLQEGWPDNFYAVSKEGIFALSQIQQRDLIKDSRRPDIIVTHVHLEHVAVDKDDRTAPLSIKHGEKYCVKL